MRHTLAGIGIFLLSYNLTLAQVDSHWESQMWTKWLPALHDENPAQRLRAAQVFMEHPQLSLPILRAVLAKDNVEERWRLAFLLGLIGDKSDIPRILSAMQLPDSDRHDVWLGSLERLYWRNRQSSPQNPVLTGFRFEPTEPILPRNRQTSGTLLMKLTNSTSQGRLLRLRLNVWRGVAAPAWPEQVIWVEAGNSAEARLPLDLTFEPTVRTVRLDLRVTEVGASEMLFFQTHEIPIAGRPAPARKPQQGLSLPNAAMQEAELSTEESEELSD